MTSEEIAERKRLLSLPPLELPEALAALAESPKGEPAFDPAEVASRAAALDLPGFSHPLLEKSVRTGLAHIDLTFRGDHPRYGVGAYAAPEHEGFPPTIVAVVDALTAWGMTQRAETLFEYWLQHFVREDGQIAYYGTSISEYGQLLSTAHILLSRGGSPEWLARNHQKLDLVAALAESLILSGGVTDLPVGVPEADEGEYRAAYFHNAAWLIRGLNGYGAHRVDLNKLRELLVAEIERAWPPEGSEDWWLRPMREPESDGYWERPGQSIVANRLGSYTNYRYWPELLSSGVLPERLNRRIVEARVNGGGDFYGVTRFDRHLDDWPLMDYLTGLNRLGMKDEYRLSLWGHILFHQAKGHLTAYEQVGLPPGRKVAEFCLPCQLVAARAAAYL